MPTLQEIYDLNGLPFIQSLLEYEKERFDKSFFKGSVFEEININFGIFPNANPYPLYFAGNIKEPKNKTIFIGINPGYSTEWNKKENEYMNERGIFEGYCNMFNFFKRERVGLLPYFANIAGFLKRLKGVEVINWDWFHDNFINLDLIPYHSCDASGLRINDVEKYRHREFEAILKILEYIDPKEPIYINGFSGFERYFSNDLFKDTISFKKHNGIWVGKIKNKYTFVGLPFLTRVIGGKDILVTKVKDALQVEGL